jgi:hypothetical protein
LLHIASPAGKTEFEVQIHSEMKGLLDIIEEYNITLGLDGLVHIANNITVNNYEIY